MIDHLQSLKSNLLLFFERSGLGVHVVKGLGSHVCLWLKEGGAITTFPLLLLCAQLYTIYVRNLVWRSQEREGVSSSYIVVLAMQSCEIVATRGATPSSQELCLWASRERTHELITWFTRGSLPLAQIKGSMEEAEEEAEREAAGADATRTNRSIRQRCCSSGLGWKTLVWMVVVVSGLPPVRRTDLYVG